MSKNNSDIDEESTIDKMDKSVESEEEDDQEESSMSDNAIKNAIKNASNSSIVLELGDIIEIEAPSNPELHQNTFFIIYLDDSNIRLANVSSFHAADLRLDEDGRITDESITKIILQSRSEERGYARQHLLLPKTWVDIHFGGEVPTIITGEITNLEEDMIELTTYPDLETIYIDFEYKGIPETIPLEQIVIRTKPASLDKIESLTSVRESGLDGEDDVSLEMLTQSEEASMEFLETGESLITMPKGSTADKTVRENLHSLYLAANEIVYGEELEDIVQRVEIPEWKKRYGIETQVNDMMDELLSEIPSIRRTKMVLDNIHLLIERFRELRKEFSRFDDQGNVVDVRIVGATHKPLVQHMLSMDRSLKWILPVVADKRKIYTSMNPESIPDVVQVSNKTVLSFDAATLDNYQKDRMPGDVPAYGALYSALHDSFTPIEPPLLLEEFLAPETQVNTPFETILSGLKDLYSTTAGKNDGYAKRQFVIQRYNLGETKRVVKASATTGRKIYIGEPMTPNDSMTIKSMITLPESAIQFSRVHLPSTSILDRTALANEYMCMFRIFKQKRTNIQQRVIHTFKKDMDEAIWEEKDGRGAHWAVLFREFIIDNSLIHDPYRYAEFLKTIIPKTSTIIDMLQKRKYRYEHRSLMDPSQLSLKRMVETLEPFMVYTKDLTYTQYNQIRYFIKVQLKEYRARLANKEKDMDSIRIAKYVVQEKKPTIEQIFSEKREFLNLIMDSYDLKYGSPKDQPMMRNSTHEWLSTMIAEDCGTLVYIVLQYMMASLITPEHMVDALDNKGENDEMSKSEKIKAKECDQRVLAKRYTSIRDMQKDNSEEDVFYDAEFDDTPYDLMKKYKDAQKKYSSEEFTEFLQEALVQKHDCPKDMAASLAQDLIMGKKRVKEGEFALVQMVPHLRDGKDPDSLSSKDQKAMEIEAQARTKVQYYRRVRKQWVHDSSIDEEAFIDTNTLFCNMGKICFRNTRRSPSTCEPIDSAEHRMREIAKRRMLEDFGSRITTSIENLQDVLKERLNEKMRVLMRTIRLNEARRQKPDILAYELGKMSKKEELVQSPYMGLRDQILGQESFVDRQNNLIKFADLYCRGAMVEELGENFHWFYCRETNVPLLPTFLFELAHTFISGGDYPRKQNEICRKQGQLSDDGDSYVDRYSGYVIKKIDFVEEDGYDESGFKVISHGIMEKDIGEAFAEAFSVSQQQLIQTGVNTKKDRVFENETAEMVYKVFSAISTNIGLDLEAVEDFVMRLSMDLIENNISSEKAYSAMSDKMFKEKEKRPPPYQIHRNQTVLIMVATVVLVSIQTACPSFKIRKTFPGCVQSFGGYPENAGIENMSGIQYIACVLNKTKSSISPWNSIQKIPLDILSDRIKKIIDTFIVPRSDIMELYEQKREYITLHPEHDIPKEHAVERWTGFMPPLVRYSVKKSLRGLTNEYKTELITSMRNGNREQRGQIGVFKVKVLLYGYDIMESIDKIVKSKDLLLKTASNLYFNENACCNDRTTVHAMDYFSSENETILPHIKMVEGWVAVLSNVRELSRASILFHPLKTGIQRMDLPAEHYEENIYVAFIHYCNLDRDVPIPEDMRGLLNEKPTDYNVRLPIADKIELMKSQGKRFTLQHLSDLMEIVNQRNIVDITMSKQIKGSRISGLTEFLDYMDGQHTPLCEKPLCRLMRDVIKTYNPKTMVLEDSEETRRLNNYLTKANEEMLTAIADFFQTYGKLNARTYAALTTTLSKVHIWDIEADLGRGPGQEDVKHTMFTVIQYLRNSVEAMSKIYPELICNNHSPVDDVNTKWGFSKNHSTDLGQVIKRFYEPLQKFRRDTSIIGLLKDVQIRLGDLNQFLDLIPSFAPIIRNVQTGDGDEEKEAAFYSLFSRRTLYMLHSYAWYSVLYEFILKTDDEELLQMDIQEQKSARRKANREREDALAAGVSVERFSSSSIEDEDDVETYAAEADDRVELQIVVGNQRELKMRVAELLLAFLEIESRNKAEIDMSYKSISERINRSKQQEKKMITDFLRNMDPEERQVENELKMIKEGRWNVGMQKGLVHYDKDTYDRERNELFLQLNDPSATISNDIDSMIRRRDVADLEADQEADADAAADQEAYDIGGLGEEYGDGRYYDEDVEDGDEAGFGYD